MTTKLSPRAAPLALLVAALWAVGGLALTRLLYEWRFPAWAALGRPLPVALVAALAAAAGVGLLWRAGPRLAVASLPFLFNLLWLFAPAVDLPRGRFLFAAGLWAAAVLWAWAALGQPPRLGDGDRRWTRLGPAFVAAALLPVYLLTMSHAVGAADTFEFQVVAPRLGIAHPTGYPLYLLLGKGFSLLPLGTVAWRLNLASAVFATLAAAVVFRLALDLLRRPLAALAGALALGLAPVYWSQAIVAEVYALHALVAAGALWLMARLSADRRPPTADRPVRQGSLPDRRKQVVALMFVIGLGLTNHLTTVFLLPPAGLAVALRLLRDGHEGRRLAVRPLLRFLPAALAFLLPLLLYLYLPLRWQAVNGEPMGAARFVDWVAGGRFQGALQWLAWLRDPARWGIVGRLLRDAWGWAYLALAAGGLLWLLRREWRAALVLLVAAAGFAFYALNYYVPDLAVFLIPTHVVIAVFVAAGVAGGMWVGEEALAKTQRAPSEETKFLRRNSVSGIVAPLVFLLALLPLLAAVGGRWSAVDQSADDGGEPWARGVLSLPLARGAAVLADSEKIAPLYYLQQIEGLRPDLDIMVLPDEAAYRAELDARLAAGQPVYLARFLPGLAGVYSLRSLGPLVEVRREPPGELPADIVSIGRDLGPLRLIGYEARPASAIDPHTVALTLYWTLARPLEPGEEPPALFVRWYSDAYAVGETVESGRHAVADTYPANAWRPGEIVADTHLLPAPVFACASAAGCELEAQVAVAPRYTPPAALAWTAVGSVPVLPRSGPVGEVRRTLFAGFALDGLAAPAQARPGAAVPLTFSGIGDGAALSFLLVPEHAVSSFVFPASGAPAAVSAAGSSRAYAAVAGSPSEAGPHALIALPANQRAVCGWLARPTTGCVLAAVAVSGAALPAGATNFANQVALLDVALPQTELTPGGQLPVELTWQGLAPMSEDYTVFVQVLDAADRIVGQVDSWPVQGTYPTSQWTPGQVVRDPYIVQLSPDLPPGDYRLHVGLYLLATLQRLPVVDETGAAVDDKVEVGGLSVSQ